MKIVPGSGENAPVLYLFICLFLSLFSVLQLEHADTVVLTVTRGD